jgi:hypothetical protein
VLEIVGIDVPAFDHNPTTGESLGLLVEEQRTNLLVQSEDFSTTWSATRASVSTNAVAAPNGTTTADKIIEDSSAGTHFITQTLSFVSDTAYTVSVYAKADPAGRFLQIAFPATAFTNTRRPCFDFVTETATAATDTTAFIQKNRDGWYRCIATMTATVTTSAAIVFGLSNINTIGSASYTGDGTSGIFLWGADLQAASTPSTYIPTTTAAVTRSADVASISGSNFSSWFNASENTMFAEGSSVGTQFPTFAEISDGTSGNRLHYAYITSTLGGFIARSGGSTVVEIYPSVSTANRKAAFAASVNNFAVSFNGAVPTLDTNAAMPISPSRMEIGNILNAGATNNLNGTIRRLTFWPARLPNATLQQLTQ